MLAGLIYDANNDSDLIKERRECKERCYDYNQLRPSDREQQKMIIRELFGKSNNAFDLAHFSLTPKCSTVDFITELTRIHPK